MNIDTLEKLFVHQLKDLYSAETQLLDAIPEMQSAASDEQLKQAFAHHLKETKTHVSRLEKIFQSMDFAPGGHKCAGMEGLIREGQELLKADIPEAVRDAALVAAAQRIEHYEIAGYGTARAHAEKLGEYDRPICCSKRSTRKAPRTMH